MSMSVILTHVLCKGRGFITRGVRASSTVTGLALHCSALLVCSRDLRAAGWFDDDNNKRHTMKKPSNKMIGDVFEATRRPGPT
jgi:hypothetical protein